MRFRGSLSVVAAGAALVFLAGPEERPAGGRGAPAVAREEFIFERAPFDQCHASTIAETRGGLAAAWFGETGEGRPAKEIER